MIQYLILRTKILTTVWQTVRRITNEIFGVRGLNHGPHTQPLSPDTMETDRAATLNFKRKHAVAMATM